MKASIVFILNLLFIPSMGFTIVTNPQTFANKRLIMSAAEKKEIECYIIDPEVICDDNGDCAVSDDEKPTVVCTSEPEEYAWFNGIDEERMHKTDGNVDIGATECVEGASPRGIEEWECQK